MGRERGGERREREERQREKEKKREQRENELMFLLQESSRAPKAFSDWANLDHALMSSSQQARMED